MAEISKIISQLAEADAAVRAAAGQELYRRGRALGESAVARWRTDAELADLLRGAPTVGIAVTPVNFELIHTAAGRPRMANGPTDQDALEFELHVGSAQLDILTTRDAAKAGAIARFLQKFGEGIQQVEYPVEDVDRATALLRDRFGERPIYPASRDGADGTRVNFFLVQTPEGKKLLIELVEPS